MKTIKNKGVVYSGKVGANMSPKRHRVSTACRKVPVYCEDGPFAWETLWLHEGSKTSGIFTVRGQTGRYVNGKWEPCK